MHILVTGERRRRMEWLAALQTGHFIEEQEVPDTAFAARPCDLLVDLSLEDDPARVSLYRDLKVPVIVSSVVTGLEKLYRDYNLPETLPLIGMNCLPTFINRPLLEWAWVSPEAEKPAPGLARSLGLAFERVADRPGMVSPRIVCMIINEAWYTLEEGTASREDIDKGMKLGTNYPYGPFEWTDLIGPERVAQVLEAVHRHTGDERYRLCPLLARETRKQNA